MNALMLRALALLAVAGPWSALQASAVEIEGVGFSAQASAGSRTVALRGVGLARYLFFDVYVAAFYTGEGRAEAPLDGQTPRRLEIAYLRSIDREDIIEAAETVLERSLPAPQRAALHERVERLHAAYVDVRAGDRYALSYSPDQGTTLALNGVVQITVPGEDFARAYFAIWLGDEPLSAALKRQLLGATLAGTAPAER